MKKRYTLRSEFCEKILDLILGGVVGVDFGFRRKW